MGAVDDKCACNKAENFVEDEARPGWCVPAVGGECIHLPNQDCDNKKCACTDGNQEQANDDGVMVCVVSLGGECMDDDDCQLIGSECSGGKCLCKAKLDGPCAETADCATDLSCQDKICKCDFTADVFKSELNGTCEITIGGSCATKGPEDCKHENQECQDPSKDFAAVTAKGVAG